MHACIHAVVLLPNAMLADASPAPCHCPCSLPSNCCNVQHEEYGYPLDTIRSRPASSNEGADYLQAPVFSNCTVLAIWYSFW